jgi:hypothetical protein
VQHKPPWWVGTVLALALVVGFAWFVWPTPWKSIYGHLPTYEARQHRVTREIQVRMRFGSGWSRWFSYPDLEPANSPP